MEEGASAMALAHSRDERLERMVRILVLLFLYPLF